MPRKPLFDTRLDAGFHANRKVADLSDAAFRTYVLCLNWSVAAHTFGVVSPGAIRMLARDPDDPSELLDAGLWHPHEQGGYVIHDFADYQSTEDKVQQMTLLAEQRREAGRQRTAAWRARKNGDVMRDASRRKDKDKDKDKEVGAVDVSTDEPDLRDVRARGACEHLANLLREAHGREFRVTPTWHTAARRLFGVDRRDAAEAAFLMRWATQDDFWSAQILSMANFRKHYDRMLIQAKRGNRRGGPTAAMTSLQQQMNALDQEASDGRA